MRDLKSENNLSHQQARHYLHLGRGQLVAAEQVALDSHLANCADCHLKWPACKAAWPKRCAGNGVGSMEMSEAEQADLSRWAETLYDAHAQ